LARRSRQEAAGTSTRDAFHNWRLMKFGARRRMNASWFDCPGRISLLPARSHATLTGTLQLSRAVAGTPLSDRILAAGADAARRSLATT
jgi:hypothetical protein